MEREVIRVHGDAVCPECQRIYRLHDWELTITFDGRPFLRVGCDGTLLKL